MRLATVESAGRLVWGVVEGDEVRDLTDVATSPNALVAAATDDRSAIFAAAAKAPLVPIHAFLPPVPEPRRIICVGINYADHAAETGRPVGAQEHPTLFVRFPSSVVGHDRAVTIPAASDQLDYEGELAVVIGRTVRAVSAADALAAVAGYACFLDGSVRDYQRHTSQFTPGKNFDGSGAWGPWITTADEVGDPASLTLTTRVSGELCQRAATSLLIHDVAAIIEYCATFTTLEPGDVIATGTPGGVGVARTPPRWLLAGDVVEVEIDRVGTLRSPVVAAPTRVRRDR